MKTRSMYKAEGMCLDRIGMLPQHILETILSLLYTKEAACTSILSTEWRYKWTKLPNLELLHSKWSFAEHMLSTSENMDERCEPCDDIHKILSLRQGPIQELTLVIEGDGHCLEFDQIISHLSKSHTVKKLTLSGAVYHSGLYNLPISVFSFHHLTDLSLCYLDLRHPPIFSGFGSLGRLLLRDVGISKKTLLHLLSNCPSLKSLTLLVIRSDDKCTISELFECLQVIEHLTTWPAISECAAGADMNFINPANHLKSEDQSQKYPSTKQNDKYDLTCNYYPLLLSSKLP